MFHVVLNRRKHIHFGGRGKQAVAMQLLYVEVNMPIAQRLLVELAELLRRRRSFLDAKERKVLEPASTHGHIRVESGLCLLLARLPLAATPRLWAQQRMLPNLLDAQPSVHARSYQLLEDLDVGQVVASQLSRSEDFAVLVDVDLLRRNLH